jgi:excisionase family DNA binding protein
MKARRQQFEPEPIAVRIPQAAAMLGIGRSTLYLLIAAGEIKAIKLGRSTLITVNELNAFVAQRAAEAD